MGSSGGSSSGSSSGAGYGYAMNLARSINSSSSNVWGAQSPALQNLYGDATRLGNEQQRTASNTANRLSSGVMDNANVGLDALTDVARTGGALAKFTNPNNDLARRQLADMSKQIGAQFSREILPGIRSGAGIGGNMGGSREALAKGVAAGDASRSIATAATDLYGNAYNSAMQAAAGVNDARINAGNSIGSMAQNVYNLGMAPLQAAWAPIMSMAQAIGGPTVLSQSQGSSVAGSQSENFNWSKSEQSGRNWGFNLW